RTSRPERLAAGRDQIGKVGDILSESTGDFISVRLGDFVGIRKKASVPRQGRSANPSRSPPLGRQDLRSRRAPYQGYPLDWQHRSRDIRRDTNPFHRCAFQCVTQLSVRFAKKRAQDGKDLKPNTFPSRARPMTLAATTLG
ncbi:hypothetical protein BST63_00410, partial [Bradyrhizobium canariense]